MRLFLLLTLLFSTPAFADYRWEKRYTFEDFESWLQDQDSILEDPILFICHQTCTIQYNRCAIKLKAALWRTRDFRNYKSKLQETCSILFDSCSDKCVEGLENLNTGSGSQDSGDDRDTPPSDGSGSGGQQGEDGSSTPPDTDTSDDETNDPGDPNQPPVL